MPSVVMHWQAATPKQQSAPLHAVLVVLNGQCHSNSPTLQCHFSTSNVVDRQRAHGQRMGSSDFAWLELADHSPSMRHQRIIKGLHSGFFPGCD